MMVEVGAARAEVTPPLGAVLAGYFHARKAASVLDPLFARALVLEGKDGKSAAVVSLDAIGLGSEDVARLRERAQAAAGLTGSRIMVCCTHTHTGPATVSVLAVEKDEQATELVVDGAVKALTSAARTMRPARVGIISAPHAGVAFNRRFRMKDGTVRTNPGVGNPDIVEPAGPVNDELTCLFFTNESGGGLAALVNFACHADIVSGDRVSADYPGYLCEALRQAADAEEILFVNGAFGDINHIDVSDKSQPSGSELARRIGLGIASHASSLCRRAEYSEGANCVATASRTVSIRVRKPDERTLSQARSLLRRPEGAGARELVYAREAVKLAEMPGQIELEIMGIRIGEFAMIALPCEPFTQVGLEIKRASPFSLTAVAGDANGYEGYLPTPEAFEEGGYEVQLARSSKLEPGAAEKVVAEAREVLAELRSAE